MNTRQLESKKRFLSALEEAGYQLHGEYVADKTKVRVECDKGHWYEASPNKFKAGQRCPVCGGQCPKTARKDFIKKVEESGYKLLSEYKDSITRVDFECDKGHRFSKTPSNFRKNCQCTVCYKETPRKFEPKHEPDFKTIVESIGYKLVTPYRDDHNSVTIECNKGHQYDTFADRLKSGERCRSCYLPGNRKWEPRNLYLTRWTHPKTRHSFLKFGITNFKDPMNRINQQAELTEYVPELISDYSRTISNSNNVINFEKEVHKKIKTGVVSKELFPDGHTETAEDTSDNLFEILNIMVTP